MNGITNLKKHSFKLSGIAITRLVVFAVACGALAYSGVKGSALTITNAIIQRAEDGAPVSPSFKFLPGEVVYFTFQIAGFKKTPATNTEASRLALSYEVVLRDSAGFALAEPATDKISAELNNEDKDWTPKRRVSFQLPSFVAAGTYRVHVSAKDEIEKAETTADYPFQIGGPLLLPSETASVQGFQFFRTEKDREPLEVPAFQAGDNIFARFRIVGFSKSDENQYRLAYRVAILRPDGKPFLRDTPDINLDSKTFYPAPYVPAEVDLTTSKSSAKGQYRLTVTVRDLIAGSSNDFHTSFSIE